MKRITLALLLFIAVNARAAVTLRLTLDSPETLPSVPVGITVTAINAGDAPVTLPAIVWMRIDRGDGQPMLLPASASSDGGGVAIPADLRSLAAHTERTICRVEPALFLTGTPWFASALIAGPGTFALQAIVSNDVPDASTSRFTSNLAKLTAVAASEDDRAAWAWLAAKGRGTWTGMSWATNAWADELLSRFPASSYAPYALAFVTAGDLNERDRVARRVLAAFPRFALADDVKLDLARQHRQESLLLQRDHPEEALRHSEAARALAADVASHAATAARRHKAEEILAHTPSRGDGATPPLR